MQTLRLLRRRSWRLQGFRKRLRARRRRSRTRKFMSREACGVRWIRTWMNCNGDSRERPAGAKGEHVVGVVVAYGGEVAWSDIFASSDLFHQYWNKLLRSYVVEALARPIYRQVASRDDAGEFLRRLNGRIHEETEPGVYRWREINEGRLSQIELDALEPKLVMLHRLLIHRPVRRLAWCAKRRRRTTLGSSDR